MTPEEFNNNINSAIENTAEEMKSVMQEAALTGKALITRRVQNIGLNKQYSNQKLPTYFFRGKALNSGGRTLYEKARKEGGGISYREWRVANGLPVNNVRLTYSGKMFQGWNAARSERNRFIIRGLVGGINREVRDKLKWNKSRFPNFDKPNPEEKKLIKEQLIRPRLKEILEQNLFKR